MPVRFGGRIITGFMAGMAANISAFNTVMSYDIWQTYVEKDKPDHWYTQFGRGGKDSAKMIQPGDVTEVVAMLVTQPPQSFISEVRIRPTQKP